MDFRYIQLGLPLEFDRQSHSEQSKRHASPQDIDKGFPLEQANALAKRESFNKHLYRPNTYLHKWWARRCGTTFRHLLKQLSDEPAKREYYSAGGLEGKIILDPMMGGGTTLHEAIRLGASLVGFDIDPIPVLQAKATLTSLPLDEKVRVFEQFFEKLTETLKPLFVTSCPTCEAGKTCESQFILYAVRKECPCGEVLMVDSLTLREEADGTIIKLCPTSGEAYIVTQQRQHTPKSPLKRGVTASSPRMFGVGGVLLFPFGEQTRPIFEKSIRQCPTCHQPFKELLEEPFFERYVPLVIVGSCQKHGRFFKKPTRLDLAQLEKAKKLANRSECLPIETLSVPKGPKSKDLLKRGISNFGDLFTPRQVIYLTTCKALLDEVDERHRLWLALLISTSLEFNCLLCGYKGWMKRRPGAIRHVFSHHAYSFPYTALENNPVFSGNTSGTLGLLFKKRIVAASRWASAPIERKRVGKSWQKVTLFGETDSGTAVTTFERLMSQPKTFLVAQQDASQAATLLPADSIDHVVSDPAYFDSVQYSDLAAFFRVWLRWFLPDEADWHYETRNSAVPSLKPHKMEKSTNVF